MISPISDIVLHIYPILNECLIQAVVLSHQVLLILDCVDVPLACAVVTAKLLQYLCLLCSALIAIVIEILFIEFIQILTDYPGFHYLELASLESSLLVHLINLYTFT